MPKRTDIKSVAIIGAGPIVIGQACEFDYSGAQACKALKEEGYRVILLNSNPATIMTDPNLADRTYVEPVTPEFLARVLRKERPDALLPTMGGQTGLNTAFQVADAGVLADLGIEMIGADRDVIHRAEDRDAFRDACRSAGCDVPKSGLARTMEEARAVLEHVGLPCIVRPAFTLGGLGGGMAYNREEFERVAAAGLRVSIVDEILIEESVERWKELEVELMADGAGNRVVVCLIENVDPMGVHTGDSIAVAPLQTLTDREVQRLRSEAMRIMEAVGLKTCGCNVQFAQCPRDGRLVAIELNPRVSRSSALASKATGYPIARIAAKVAVGYLLPEIGNPLLGAGSACFEPAVDYVVVKFPRFAFEKFPGANEDVTIQMKSVGEVMAIGGTFKEAVQKGMRSLENGRHGWGADGKDLDPAAISEDVLLQKLSRPNRDRFMWLRYALQRGMGTEEIFALTGIDPWWLEQLREILEMEKEIVAIGPGGAGMDARLWRRAKEYGFSDVQLGHLLGTPAGEIRRARLTAGVRTVYKAVDGCAGRHDAARGYYWGTFGDEDESRAGTTGRDAILILGGGPNRIGQGLEFDYCCCHAAYAVHDADLDAVLANCNPETVSTDFDTSDRLYFEPLTVEDVLAIVDREKPRGVIVQFGGQTPLNISRALLDAGVTILGTSVDSIDRASDRGQFSELLRKLGLRQPPNGTATTLDAALDAAGRVGYPVLCRPSFVLGGAKMEIVADDAALRQYWRELLVYCTKADVEINERRPILLDKFLDDAIEVDVDAIADGQRVYIAGVMEHIEEAGVHSGDSACSLPPHSLSGEIVAEMEAATRRLALELGVRGLMNVQYAIRGGEVHVLEVNPRASRTVPFVSKVTGVPVARLATRVMLGSSLESLGLPDGSAPRPAFFGVKEAVFPFSRFPGADAILGPEMKSTGEVMGLDPAFPLAFAKSQLGAGQKMPLAGTAFMSVRGDQHGRVAEIAQSLHKVGFKLVATSGTARAIRQRQIPVEVIAKISVGRPNVLDLMADNRLHLVVNVPSGKSPTRDEISIRTTAVTRGVPLVTTLAGARAFAEAARRLKREGDMDVHALQDAMPVWEGA